MISDQSRRFDLQAEIFKALSHPLRIRMLYALRVRPYCVCELAAELGIEKSVASKYLAQLKSTGLVADERHGTLVEYRLVTPCILDMADCAERTVIARRKREYEELVEGTLPR